MTIALFAAFATALLLLVIPPSPPTLSRVAARKRQVAQRLSYLSRQGRLPSRWQ